MLSRDLRFDSSVGRGDLITEIGVGRVIRGTYLQSASQYTAQSGRSDRRINGLIFCTGWDEGILGSASAPPMSLGEKATLTISAYVMRLIGCRVRKHANR